MARGERGEALTALPAILNPEQRLTATQAMALTGRGRSQFYEDVRRGRLPQPERYGPRFSRWRAGDLLDAMRAARAVCHEAA